MTKYYRRGRWEAVRTFLEDDELPWIAGNIKKIRDSMDTQDGYSEKAA
jgi:hypothetical protein